MTIAEKIMLAGAPELKPAPDKATDKRRALGRGLDSLLPGRPRVVSPTPAVISGSKESASSEPAGTVKEAPTRDQVEQIPLDQIDENPYQTRQQFDEAALDELAQSIRASGLLQPIVVRSGVNGRY